MPDRTPDTTPGTARAATSGTAPRTKSAKRRADAKHRLRWGYLAGGWSITFAAAHIYWALGGRTGLDVSAGPDLSNDRPGWFVVGGLFGVGALLVVGAAVAVLLERDARWVRLLRLLGWTASTILLVRGIGLELLMIAGVVHAGDGITAAQIRWTWALWNPWFIVGGICYALTTARFSRRCAESRTAEPADTGAVQA